MTIKKKLSRPIFSLVHLQLVISYLIGASKETKITIVTLVQDAKMVELPLLA